MVSKEKLFRELASQPVGTYTYMLQHSRLRRIRRLVAMLGASGVIALVLLLLRRRRELLTRLLPAPAAPRRCVTSAPQHDAVLLAPLPPALPRTAAPSLQLSWEGEVALVSRRRPKCCHCPTSGSCLLFSSFNVPV